MEKCKSESWVRMPNGLYKVKCKQHIHKIVHEGEVQGVLHKWESFT